MSRAAPTVDPALQWWDAHECARRVGLRNHRSWHAFAARSLILREGRRDAGTRAAWLSSSVLEFLQFPDLEPSRRLVTT